MDTLRTRGTPGERGRGFRLERQNLNAVVASTSRELNLAILATLLTPTRGNQSFYALALINRAREATVFLPCFFSSLLLPPLSFFSLLPATYTAPIKQRNKLVLLKELDEESSRSVTNEVTRLFFWQEWINRTGGNDVIATGTYKQRNVAKDCSILIAERRWPSNRRRANNTCAQTNSELSPAMARHEKGVSFWEVESIAKGWKPRPSITTVCLKLSQFRHRYSYVPLPSPLFSPLLHFFANISPRPA